ncbi:MAG: HEAT repeat domain-containing protein [Candidatus Brocadiaceae bacterium]|nr:HEAT repeat domain-containing protein [Candidatus Brocadiaceae bacterium]
MNENGAMRFDMPDAYIKDERGNSSCYSLAGMIGMKIRTAPGFHFLLLIIFLITISGAGCGKKEEKDMSKVAEILKDFEPREKSSRSSRKEYSEQEDLKELERVVHSITQTRKKGSVDLAVLEKKTEIPECIKAFSHESDTVKLFGAITLLESGKEAIPVLVQTLGSGDRDVRVWACATLVVIGSEAASAISKAMKNEDDMVRKWAEYAQAGLILDMQ